MNTHNWTKWMAGAALCLAAAVGANGEAILQVFNQSHNEIAARLPEIAEAGYTALWVPPPTKANGGMSVGYDLNDPFDIGNSDLRGTWSTRYGVEADLHNLIELCHRFGMRVYFDNVMNHRSYDVPGWDENTPTDVYPGMCPEDFHLRTTSDGFYRKWDNVRDWNDEWQVMYLGLSDLLDIAHEVPNKNFGPAEHGEHAKPFFVRHPNNPELYDRKPNGDYVGFGENNGITTNDLADNFDFYKEDVGGYLCRAVRWLVDRTRVDGLRLDAVKHVPWEFFGRQGDDASSEGYVGQVQWQFNMTRGFSDWANHRDTVFDSDAPRNDAMLFGEHLGNPPPQGPYVGAGMRLVDDRLRNELNWRFSANQLEGFDGESAGSELGPYCGVMHAQSHDNDFVDRKPLHHAMYFMRRGLGLVYSDGNNHAATLTGSGGAFPRWACTDFLGQWHQKQIPTLLHAHENFARYDQLPKWSSGNYIAFQRGGGIDDEGNNWATMLFMLNSAWDWWEPTKTRGDFPRDAWLYDYASDYYMPYFKDNGPEAAYAWGGDLEDGNVNLPNNSYAIWNWKNPDPSGLYPTPYPECFVNGDDRVIAPDSRVITVMENGTVVEPVWVTRKDGADGDPDFNPYGVADTNSTDYSYRIAIPRVTGGTNVTLAVKGDGSAETLLLRLDGGMDFGNGINGWYREYNDSSDPGKYVDREDWRDNPPGAAHDFYLGFENAGKWFTRRIWSEKFASVDTDYCKIGTQGATSYESAGGGVATHTNATVYEGARINEPGFVYHDPSAETEMVPVETGAAVTTTNTYTALASATGQGGADGFGGWVDSSTNGDGDGGAGWFVHTNVSATGLSGFAGNQAYGLWAKHNEGGWPNAQVARSLSHGGKGLLRASVDVGMKFDSNIEGRYKGVEFTDASGNAVFGVQMQNSPVVTYYGAGGGGTWSEGYGEAAFRVELERTSAGYRIRGTTRDGGTFGPLDFETGAEIAGFKAYMNGVIFDKDTDDRQLYFDNLSYTAVVTTTPTGDRQVPQFAREGTGATVWAKTSQEKGARTFLYYTEDGEHWPEGGGGVPANPYTKAVEGSWKANSESGSWWRFDLSGVPADAVLRYKISAFREMGYAENEGVWETVWPGNPDAIEYKKAMMSLWTVGGLDFTKQGYHKHNDYTSWTTGFKDGYHLATARLLLNRNDGAPVANTFRQTFYLDREVPNGEWMYPAADGESVGGNEYGMVVRTDQTVDEVWYHIEDANPFNDGPGNGTNTAGVVEWAQADRVTAWNKEMAQNTDLPRVWRFTYKGIAAGKSNATVRVRLREVSSAPADEWDKASPTNDVLSALHVRELTRTVVADGPNYYMYFDWPTQANEMVQAGWNIRLKVCPDFAAGKPGNEAKALFNMTLTHVSKDGKETNTTRVAGSSDAANFEWKYPNDSELTFAMPNVFTGNEEDTFDLAVTGTWDNGGEKPVTVIATNIVRTKGPLLPTCIITTPPETDSDGAKWIVTMEDSVAAREGGRELRETPIVVLTDTETTKLDLAFVSPEGYEASMSVTAAAARAASLSTNEADWPSNDLLRLRGFANKGSSMVWTFAWQVTNAGTYRFEAKVKADNSGNPRKYSVDSDVATNGAFRTATVRFVQKVATGAADDLDWDNDGISNVDEKEKAPAPKGEAEYWTQDDIFRYMTTGLDRVDPGMPDTDEDGLPDGLELGHRRTVEGSGDTAGTDAGADTNGDGWPNFIWDRDPPFYNSCQSNEGKVPGVTTANQGGDRTAIVQGTVTDPRNPDTDNDGLPDGVEDANRNGWVDGDGKPIGGLEDPPGPRQSKGDWPNGKAESWEQWEETSPLVWDSDGDGLGDGYEEDANLNGWTDMGLIYEDAPDTVVPLTPADYEELGIGVDAYSRENSASTLDPKPYTSRAIDYRKLFEKYNVTDRNEDRWPRLVILETDPLRADTDGDGLPDGWEQKYGLDPLNNGVYNFRTGQWTDDDTHGAGGNPDGDTYPGGPNGEWIPYDNAAEYKGTTDPRSYNDFSGGGTGGGEGVEVGVGAVIGTVNNTEYFKEFTWWTLDDLVALDDYNQGGNSSDIYRWGDGFDSSRDMVAFYFRDGGQEDGKVYFRVDFDDLKPYAEESSLNIYVAINIGNYGTGITALPDDVNCNTEMKWNLLTGVYDSQNGCLYRQTADEAYEILPGGYYGAYFNSELDSVMWSIDRKALTGTGWNGSVDKLMFQIYTTRDFTGDDGGSGDKGGLNDFADIFGGGENDWICSDYWNDYNYIANNGVYSKCASRDTSWDDDPEKKWKAFNNCGQHANLAMVAHGNQAIEPGNAIQALVNDGKGAGYDRPVQIHNIYTNCPLNLHITPTLAMALQWAETGTTNAWASGPSFNASIKRGVASGALALIGSTYSDHILRYFGDGFNKANEQAARAVLNSLYGDGEKDAVSKKVLWSAERVADTATFRKMRAMGFEATVVDQTPHLLEWFGRQTSLGSGAYKIQRYWLKDASPEIEAKAFVLSSTADNFRYANTDGGLSEDLRHLFLRRARSGQAAISSIFYRWEDFANMDNANGYDRSLRWIANHPWIQVVTFDEALDDPGLGGDNMHYKDMDGSEGMAMQDWVHHACNGNYDNWFRGEASRPLESLADKKFQIRDGEDCTPQAWGTADGGIFASAWASASGLKNAQLKALAEATVFASVFETAFHDEANNDLSRWSYGKYMYPATDAAGLMAMAWCAQSRTRLAAVYAEVDAWAGKKTGLEAYAKDLDLDGEDEWVLRNDKVMAVFEAEGGVMVGAWLKDDGGEVWQMVGNFAAQPETGYETQSTGPDSKRGTALKDVWVNEAPWTAERFGVTRGEGSLMFETKGLSKTVRLADASTGAFEVEYAGLFAGTTNYVRNGLSPDLATLMATGQSRMSETVEGTNAVTVATATGAGKVVSARVAVRKGGINVAAKDQPENAAWNTVNLRNAAQVRQVEVEGLGEIAFSLEFKAEDAVHAPPVITVTPNGEQSFPVGKTSSFRVTATDWNANALAVEAVSLPEAPYQGGAPSWNSGTGMLSWTVGPLGSAGTRTNAWRENATFRARDADGREAEESVAIAIPWDANGNGISDDWEWLQFRNEEKYDSKKGADFDGDGFDDYSEWTAGTNPKDDEEYIAWERQIIEGTNMTLVFRSVAGAPYQIESTDSHGLVAGGTNWSWFADVVGDPGNTTTWIGERPGGESRMYRIKVPFRER